MTDEKMIEEMARIICKETSNKGVCEKCGFKKHIQFGFVYQCAKFDNAKNIYDAGYRKISKGSVVLTDEEYSDYLILQQNHEFIREKAKKLQEDNERLYKNIGKFKDIVRKETAREILDKVGKVCGDYQWFKNLRKEYGVEVE